MELVTLSHQVRELVTDRDQRGEMKRSLWTEITTDSARGNLALSSSTMMESLSKAIDVLLGTRHENEKSDQSHCSSRQSKWDPSTILTMCCDWLVKETHTRLYSSIRWNRQRATHSSLKYASSHPLEP
ncbi:hypothetical protein Bca52824_017310 [Brassica carinata]|uniref:Uncharacterized protein n=1 Tax=Brassica carinata TaxID=52824 RepID=A0A8X7VND2_BRACI|nr:hypothetical protein Bca52824_017310 [Brassica carinata]